MTTPAFQFYPHDHLANVKLRRCSHAARGVWMDIQCYMHDADEYGVLRWSLAEIAQVVNAPAKIIRELVERGVLKGADSGAEDYIYTPRHAGQDGDPVVLVRTTSGPCWYSSRMVRDGWKRDRRGANTRFDADNQPPKRPPNPLFGQRQEARPKPPFGERQGDGASTSSANPPSEGKNKGIAATLLADVDPQIAADWQAFRAGRRAAITKTAVDGIRAEAAKAGLSLADALSICCSNGWTGFKASWVRGNGSSAASARDAGRAAAAATMMFDNLGDEP